MRFEVKLHNSFALGIFACRLKWNASTANAYLCFPCINITSIWLYVWIKIAYYGYKATVRHFHFDTHNELNDGTCHFSNLFHFRDWQMKNFVYAYIYSLSKTFSMSKLPHDSFFDFGDSVKGCWRQCSFVYFNGYRLYDRVWKIKCDKYEMKWNEIILQFFNCSKFVDSVHFVCFFLVNISVCVRRFWRPEILQFEIVSFFSDSPFDTMKWNVKCVTNHLLCVHIFLLLVIFFVLFVRSLISVYSNWNPFVPISFAQTMYQQLQKI